MRRNIEDRGQGSDWSGSGSVGGARRAPLLPVGDRAAMGDLFARHAAQLRGVALRYTRNPDVASDVLQSAFEKVLRNGHQFRGGSKISTWLYRVVANESLMWLRAERRRGARFADGEPADLDRAADPKPGVAERLEDREELERLREAIRLLGPEERAVIEGCALAERSYAEWGSEQGLHPAAVKSRAFRARQHLRELLT